MEKSPFNEYNDIFIDNWEQLIKEENIYKKISWGRLVENYKLPLELIKYLHEHDDIYLLQDKLIQHQIWNESELIEFCIITMKDVDEFKTYEQDIELFQGSVLTDTTILRIKTMLELVKDS